VKICILLALVITLSLGGAGCGGVTEDKIGDDFTPPTAGGAGAVTVSAVTSSSISVFWSAALDDQSGASDLKYCLFTSTDETIDTVMSVVSTGRAATTWIAGTTTLTADELLPGTIYYINVLVADEAGNAATYSGLVQQTDY